MNSESVAIDMPGFGAAHDVTGYAMEDIARQFAEVVEGLGIERCVLVGHSMTEKVMSILGQPRRPCSWAEEGP